MRYFLNSERPTDEGIDTPLAFDFGLARTPPTDPSDPLYAEKLASRANPCEAADHTVKGYDRTPDYDAFWLERDYRKDAANIRAAALVAHGWQDYNVKQEEGVDLYRALTNTAFKRLYMWQAGHSTPGRRELAAAARPLLRPHAAGRGQRRGHRAARDHRGPLRDAERAPASAPRPPGRRPARCETTLKLAGGSFTDMASTTEEQSTRMPDSRDELAVLPRAGRSPPTRA